MLNQKYINLIKNKINAINDPQRIELQTEELNRCVNNTDYTACVCFDNFGVIGDTIVSYDGKSSVVKIPADIRGLKIKRIGAGAFYRSNNLRVLEVAEGIEEIGESAFAACEKLVNISLPSTMQFIEKDAFALSGNIEDFSIVLEIGKTEYELLMESGIETQDGKVIIDQSIIAPYNIEDRFIFSNYDYPTPCFICREMRALFSRRYSYWDVIAFKGYTHVENERDGVKHLIKEGWEAPENPEAEIYCDRVASAGRYSVYPDKLRIALLDAQKTYSRYGRYYINLSFLVRNFFYQSVEKFAADGKVYYAYTRKYLTGNPACVYEKEYVEILTEKVEIATGKEEDLAYRKYRLITSLG